MQSFHDLGLSAPVLRALVDLNFKAPTEIQAATLPILLGPGTDFIGLAATGTGKTAAFAIPLLERLNDQKGVQALILCPTRELVTQVAEQINLLGRHLGVSALPIYGGTGYEDQIAGLRRGAKVVVGTPGRLVDHLEKGRLDLSVIHTLVLDEADEMISMGFKESLESILAAMPKGQCHTWLFSATMNREVSRVAHTYLTEPQQVQANRREMLPQALTQLYYTTRESNKPEVLCKLIDAAESFYGLIFCQTKMLVADLTDYLVARGYRVDCLHGDKGQAERERAMQAFREKRVDMLVCTDVAARGLDVKDVSHVINYSIPRELENYVHRIGRTARGGKQGYAMSLVTASHRHLVERIERMTKSVIEEGRIPSRKDIGKRKATALLAGLLQQDETHGLAMELLDEAWQVILSNMSKEEIAGRFMAMAMPHLFGEAPKITLGEGAAAEAGAAQQKGRGKSGEKSSRWASESRERTRGDRHGAERHEKVRVGFERGKQRVERSDSFWADQQDGERQERAWASKQRSERSEAFWAAQQGGEPQDKPYGGKQKPERQEKVWADKQKPERQEKAWAAKQRPERQEKVWAAKQRPERQEKVWAAKQRPERQEKAHKLKAERHEKVWLGHDPRAERQGKVWAGKLSSDRREKARPGQQGTGRLEKGRDGELRARGSFDPLQKNRTKAPWSERKPGLGAEPASRSLYREKSRAAAEVLV